MAKKQSHPTTPSRKFIPSYRRQKRPNGQDDAFVELGGVRRYLGPYGSPESRELYNRLLTEWETSGRSVVSDPQGIPVAEVASLYLKWANGYYIKHGHVTAEPMNIVLAVRPMLNLYGRAPAVQFGPKALKAVRQAMIELGWSRRHINKQVDRIKRMFKWAVAEEILPPHTYEGLRAVGGLRYGRSGAPEPAPVPPAPIQLVEPVKQCVSRQVAAMIDMQLLTGARPGEIVILRPCDIDRSGPVWVYRPNEHKTEHHGHTRTIFLGPKAQEILAPFLLRSADAYCFSPAEAEHIRQAQRHALRKVPKSCGNSPGTHRKVSPQWTPGDRYDTQTYGKAINRACETAFPLPEDLARRPHTITGQKWALSP